MFDILGDEVGWQDAVWIMFAMLVVPFVVWCILRFVSYFFFRAKLLARDCSFDIAKNPLAESETPTMVFEL